MKNNQNILLPRTIEARSYAHHYGAVRRAAAPERKLRVYAPLAWGVMPHVRRIDRLRERNISQDEMRRFPLPL